MRKIIIIHGPNINMIGRREPDIYGKRGFDKLNEDIIQACKINQVDCDIKQSNCEGDIISIIQNAEFNYSGIIINPGAYTHYSYAIRDSIASVNLPCIEVHLTNIYSREEFRAKSVIQSVCIGQISGFGFNSYIMAITALKKLLD